MNDKAKEPLNLCRKCGAPATYCHIKELGNPRFLKFKVECTGCDTETNCFKSPEKAAAAWNNNKTWSRSNPPVGSNAKDA